MHISFKNIQNDIKLSKNLSNNIYHRQSLMLKMVTSYSIFLFIILLLCVYLYVSDARASRRLYNWQAKATLMSNVQLFEKDIDIMKTYCRQLMQDGRFRTLARNTEVDNELLILGNTFASSVATDVYPQILLPMTEVYCYFPNSDYILGSGYFVKQDRFYKRIKGYAEEVHEIFMEVLTTPEYYYHFIPMDAFLPRSGKDFYMYVIDLNDLNYMDVHAVTYFVLEKEELSSLFDCMKMDVRELKLCTPANIVRCIICSDINWWSYYYFHAFCTKYTPHYTAWPKTTSDRAGEKSFAGSHG